MPRHPHLGAQGANAHHSAELHLEANVCGGRLTWWRFYFRFFNGAIRSEQVIEFLTALRRQIKGRLLIIWDGVATHRSRLVRHWLEKQDGHIAVAALPPYAPELNPVEAIWVYLKKHEIANLCLNTIAEVSAWSSLRHTT